LIIKFILRDYKHYTWAD